jgi:hypothetical protein
MASHIELHGLEDGTVPATFQIIYLVESLSYTALYLPFNVALDFSDWLETCPNAAEAIRTGNG